MAQEPSTFQRDPEGAVQLVRADALLARCHQVHCLEPNMHRDMAGLHDGADLDRERLTAGVALVEADPVALALERAATADHATMRADPPIRPYPRLDVSVSGCFVVEVGGAQNGRHGSIPQNVPILRLVVGNVKYNIPRRLTT